MGQVETSEWLKMLRRMIRAAGRRVANADEHELADLVSLRDQLDQSITPFKGNAPPAAPGRTLARPSACPGRALFNGMAIWIKKNEN